MRSLMHSSAKMFRSILGALQGVSRPSEDGIRVLVLQESRKSHFSHVVRAVIAGIRREGGATDWCWGKNRGVHAWEDFQTGKLHVEREWDRSGCDTFEEPHVCLREASGLTGPIP